jgi:glyoxylase-like metal-dependent hydrolase (beta-lactamase superfamily II)
MTRFPTFPALWAGGFAAALGLFAAAGDLGHAQQAPLRTLIVDPARGIHYADASDRTVRALPVRDNVYMIVGAGANITVQTGASGVLVVDTGSGAATDKVLSLLRQLSPAPIRYILNTSHRPDHTGGNDGLRTAAGGAGGAGRAGGRGGRGVPIAAHENVLARMSAPSGKTAPTPSNAWPTETFYTLDHDLYFNGEGIQMFHQPNAVTDGDTIVYFRRSDVISAGDVYPMTTYPVIDLNAGGSINGVIDALNRILKITIPQEKQEGGTLVISGHGRISDEADVVEYRDMLTIVRDRIEDAIRKGRTLPQIQAAGLTRDYDPRYGTSAGPWTTPMFIEAAYESLTRQRERDGVQRRKP